MNKTKFICGAVFAMMIGGVATAMADDITAIMYSEDNQAIDSAPIETQYAITFGNDGINVLNADKQLLKTVPYAGVHYIQLMGVAAVGMLEADSSLALKENPVGSTLEIVGYGNGATTLRIYDLAGRQRLAAENWNGESVNVSNLSPGMYIVSIDSTTIKFIKK